MKPNPTGNKAPKLLMVWQFLAFFDLSEHHPWPHLPFAHGIPCV